MKIIEIIKDRPILKIERKCCSFDYIKDEKTRITGSLGLTNKGRRPISVKKVAIDLLDDEKRKLYVSVPPIPIVLGPEIKRKLEPGDYVEIPLECVIKRKLSPIKSYFVQVTVLTSHKDYNCTLNLFLLRQSDLDDWVNVLYPEVD